MGPAARAGRMAEATETSLDPSGDHFRLTEGIRTAIATAVAGLRLGFLAVFGVGWVAFWANLVRIHLAQGALVPTFLTLIVLVGPALALGVAMGRG